MYDKAYIAVFFDVDLPALPNEARQIRLTKDKYINLMDNALPDKTVELVEKDKSIANYSIVSRRVFHLKNSVDNTMFLICDVKKAEVSELLLWLNEQKGLEKVNNFFYRFLFNDKWCVGQVTIMPDYEELKIRANLNTHDIGNGEGVPVYKKFKRK